MQMTKVLVLSAATLVTAVMDVSAGDIQSQTLQMSFEACQTLIQRTADQFGQAPINIVETPIMRMVRFVANDGSVLVTCSKPDAKAVVTKSPYRG